MLCIVYQLNTETQDYHESSRFNIEGNPVELFINDAGDRIVTLDQYFGIGQGPRVVVVYSTKGRELKKWGLKDFYDKKKIENLPETTASVIWRGSAGWTIDQKGIKIFRPVGFEDSQNHFDNYFVVIRKLKITKWEPARIPGIKIVEQ